LLVVAGVMAAAAVVVLFRAPGRTSEQINPDGENPPATPLAADDPAYPRDIIRVPQKL
jgi:hypothetical protein